MALNLKRKRGKDSSSRKARKLSPEEDLIDDIGDHNSNDDGDSGSEVDENLSDANEEEDEEWQGVSDPQQNEQIPDHTADGKPQKPNREELRNIRDASDLFRSNTFKLQIDALLPNVRPSSKKTSPLERFLLSLHTFLSNIPDVPPKHPLEAARGLLKKGVSVPYSAPLPTEDTNWKVAFAKPSEITLVGSWANKTSVKGRDGVKYGVDLAVEMPSSLFQEKDYLNGRFFHKKAFYLANLAAAINSPKSGLNIEASYISNEDDPRLTKLVLEPRADDSPNDFTKLKARVYIIPVLSTDSPISLHRLSPAHANLRVTSEDVAGEDSVKLPTPLYNTALLTSLTPKSHLLSTHALQKNAPAFNDAVSLLRVWANQRGYGEGAGASVRGFDGKGSWWAALLGFLIMGEEPSSAGLGKSIKRKPVGRGLSSYQLFRAALDFLSKHDLENEPVFVKTGTGHKFLPDEYQSNFDAVFVDSSSTVNLLAGVPVGSLKLLAIDARKTLETLNNASSSADPFPEVFLKDHRDLQTRFDAVIHVDLSTVKPRKTSVHQTLDTGSAANALMASMSSLLSQGLGDRVKAVAILHPTPTARPLSQAHPSSAHIIHIGLVYDTQNAFRQVDRGPPATESDTSLIERFREFWGDKAELRRFKDSSIVESVVWDVKTVDEKAHIPTMVVRHILKHHFGLEDDAVHAWQAPFDSLLRLPESISRFYVGSGLSMGFKGAITAFDNLVKSMKSLDDEIPLALLNVSAASESLRYTSVFSPVPLPSSIASVLPPNARYLHPIEIVLEFEKSSRWPDDLRAIQKVKLAFFERIASALMKLSPGLKASVVVGDGVSDSEIQDNARLEIVTSDGWAFSARIWHEREATLLDNIIDDTGGLPHVKVKSSDRKKGKEYHDAVRAREVYTRQFIHAPQHHRAIAKLCHHFPAFAGTVRLVKRWFASHWLLHGHVSEEVVELLCAQFFVIEGWDQEVEKENSNLLDRIDIPGSKERGFASAMQFLKDWKWEEGLFVPLYNSSVTPPTQPKVVTSASTGVWKISTKMDTEGLIWALRGPDVIVARRIQALAQATWKCLQDMEASGKLTVQSMFDHPTEDYNVVMKLDPAVLPRYHQNVLVDASKLSRGAQSNIDPILIRPGFDPAQALFEDLQRAYQDTFRIFHDPFGGDRYGAVWDPALRDPRPFRVMGGFSNAPSEDPDSKSTGKKAKDLVSLNEQGVLGEIERLGRGIICGITVHV